MARRKIFRKKTFSKKHKSRRGRKITSNKTRRIRGGFAPIMAFTATQALANSEQGKGLMNAVTNATTSSPQGQALIKSLVTAPQIPTNGTLPYQ